MFANTREKKHIKNDTMKSTKNELEYKKQKRSEIHDQKKKQQYIHRKYTIQVDQCCLYISRARDLFLKCKKHYISYIIDGIPGWRIFSQQGW
jgi:hypothetical protein